MSKQRSMDVIYYVATSLDGYIATPDGGVDWLNPYGNVDYGYAEFYASIDALLMGSGTYEVGLEMSGGELREADKPTWVFTSRDLPVPHAGVTLTDEDPIDVVEMLRAEGYRRVWLMGGGELAASFRTRGLITHYSIGLIPVLLGGGIPLFADAKGQTTLTLTRAEPYPNGLVILHYESAVADPDR